MYELINYSDHGTIVDNIIYTLNPGTGQVDVRTGTNIQTHSSSGTQSASINTKTAEHQAEKCSHSVGKKASSGKFPYTFKY